MAPVAKITTNGKPKEMQHHLELVVNEYLIARTRAIQRLLDPPHRDIDKECGYPATPGIEDYRQYYDREGIATRVVSVFPDESWSVYPELYEVDDENEETPLETAWKSILSRHNPWYHLHRIDELSGIGEYGVLLLGVNDGATDLSTPVQGVDPRTGLATDEQIGQRELLFIKPFDQSLVTIKEFEGSIQSPRMGQPTMYQINLLDTRASGINQTGGQVLNTQRVDVHWTRVLHVADNRRSSDTFGTPRMQGVLNRLYDLRKILSGSGEMFWKGAFPGISFETMPETNTSEFEVDKESLKGQIFQYMHGLQRYLALEGVTAKPLLPQLGDPEKHVQEQLRAVALSLGIPYRIFLGSEAAHLASTQDIGTWNKRLFRRQTTYLTPMLIRPFVDRLIAYRVLPRTQNGRDYTVAWTDLNSMTDKDRADVALKRAQAMMAYVAGNVEQVVPPLEFLTTFVGLSLPVAQAIIKSAKENTDDKMFTKKTLDAATDTGNRSGTPSGTPTNAKPGSSAGA